MYYVILTDHHPTLGGDTQYGPLPTRKEAQWYGEREVAAAVELGFNAPVTFKVVRAELDPVGYHPYWN